MAEAEAKIDRQGKALGDISCLCVWAYGQATPETAYVNQQAGYTHNNHQSGQYKIVAGRYTAPPCNLGSAKMLLHSNQPGSNPTAV
jgi:hypothetical protein